MRTINWDSEEFKGLDVDSQLNILLASAAQLAYDEGDGRIPEEPSEVDEGAPFIIPLLIPEELESGDGRSMEKGALSTRNLPITLLWQPSTGQGHDGSYVVGRIDTIEELDNGLGNARGVFDTGPYGRESERLVRAKMLRGVSADLDMFEATVNAAGEELAEEDFDPTGAKGEKIKSEKMTVNKARVMAATLVAKPAFQECTIELVSEDNMDEEFPMEDGVYEENPPTDLAAEFALSSLIASAAPVSPPMGWFENPSLNAPTPLTTTDDGHVFGHIATWDTDHVGFSTGVKPPRSRSNYAYFRTGLLKTEEGEDIAVGQLTLLGGHAPLDANAQLAVKHYDDTQSAIADVTAGEDQFGIWVSGALRPHVTPEMVRTFRASAPSGDWRPINGVLELVAVTQVNVPGFPVARARVASGSVMALVAAGTATLHKMRDAKTDDLSARLASVEAEILTRRKSELSTGIVAAREARRARLLAAAEEARAAFAPQFEKKAQLAADADAVRQRFQEFKLQVKPDFKDALHPRDDNGKFREVLLKLSDILKAPDADPDAVAAKDDLQKAADADAAGDTEGARAAAESAKSKLEKAASKADADPAAGDDAGKLHDVADDVADVAGGPAVADAPEKKGDGIVKKVADKVGDVAKKVGDEVGDVVKGDAPGGGAPAADIGPEDLPPEIKDFIETMLDELGESADPKSILSRMDNSMKHWLEGKGFDSPEAFAKLIQKMMQKPIQPDIGQ